MTTTVHRLPVPVLARLTTVGGVHAPPPPRSPAWRRPVLVLAGVAVACILTSLAVLGITAAAGSDETPSAMAFVQVTAPLKEKEES